MFKKSVFATFIACLLSPTVVSAADLDAGSYLAARQAGMMNDFSYGARYFTKGLIADPDNAALLENAMTSYIALGQFERAIPIAQAITDYGYDSQIANMTMGIAAAKSGDWDAIFTALEQDQSVGPLVDGLAQGWAHMGRGEMKKALDSFDQVIDSEGMEVYGLTHKAFALAIAGDFEGAEDILGTSGFGYSRRSAIAHVQILSQLGRNDDALSIMDAIFGSDPDAGLAALRADIVDGKAVAYNAVGSPTAGMAEIFHTIAEALRNDAADAYTLLYARAATYLAPDNTQAILLTGGLLDDLGQYELANQAYASIARDDPYFHAAELGRAATLRSAGRDDAALEVLDSLARSHAEMPQVHATRGDMLRQTERFEDATVAYSRALDLYEAEHPARWFVHYTRGIVHHKLDEWPDAEGDFRAALALNPKQPQVLNYLGYSLVERGEKLDEALRMIETAADARPDNGAIIDSLGWVMFQLGRYEEAVDHLELAASLLPVDPVINDHLGDAYWAVGRKTEAEFQWKRALSFGAEPTDASRIRAKLERGLDMVRREEGLDPVQVARGNN